MFRLLSWMWWWVLPVRKAEAVANYGSAFPDRDPGELREMMRWVLRQYFQVLIGSPTVTHGIEAVPKGAICLCGHFGPWDSTLIAVGQRMPATIFVKEPSNKLAAALIKLARGKADLELLPPSNSMDAAYKALERGRLVMFVQDQRYNAGIDATFFGRPAKTSAAFASMAWRTRAPMVGLFQWTDEHDRCHLGFETLDWAIAEDRDQAITELTQRSQDYYERKIREVPWAWLWLHRRWR